MRKLLLSSLLGIVCTCAFAQNPTLQQKLFYTCKVWGFVKFYHSNVSICNVNWDSVLLHTLPLVKNATTNNDFNDALDTMLAAAGPMTIAITPLPDTIAPELKRNRAWQWTDDAIFRTDVRVALDTIKNNFRPHNICWVNDTFVNTYTHGGGLEFPHDTILLHTNTYVNYPDEYHRLLIMFKEWNIINYFDPYTYVFDKPADSILANNVLQIDTVNTPPGLYSALRHLTSGLDDTHTEDMTSSANYPFPVYHIPQLSLQYIQNKYVVVKSGIGIPVGDAITAVNGKTVTQWEDSLSQIMSISNQGQFHRFMSMYLIEGEYGTTISLDFADPQGNTGSLTTQRYYTVGDSLGPDAPSDSLAHIHWCQTDCGIGYINIGTITEADINSAWNALQNAPAIIFDLRNYPADLEAFYDFANRGYVTRQCFVRFTIPDVTYPGTFTRGTDSAGVLNNPTPYNGTAILLFNQETQSAAEDYCMQLSALPHVIKIGSQTAGTDGDMTYFMMTDDIRTAFTCYGVYWPNGDSTERIGIVPDSTVTPTIAGIIQGRDEVLEKALQVGCQVASVPMVSSNPLINVYPNPANDVVNISLQNLEAGKIIIRLTDITGKLLIEKETDNYNHSISTYLNIASLPAGMYLVNVNTGTEEYTRKVAKE